MSPGLDPDKIICRFRLPKKTRNRIGGEDVTEYRGIKYLAVAVVGDRIDIRIDGRPVLEYDAVSDEICRCSGIDDSSIYVTDRIACSYGCAGTEIDSCYGPRSGPMDPENIRFIILPCHISTRICMRMDKNDDMKFSISRNWSVEVEQCRGDGESISFSGPLVENTDFFITDNRYLDYRFLLPKTLEVVRCDEFGIADDRGAYQWCLEYDVSGFEREWLIANNPGLSEESLNPEPSKQCYIISPKHIAGGSVELQ